MLQLGYAEFQISATEFLCTLEALVVGHFL